MHLPTPSHAFSPLLRFEALLAELATLTPAFAFELPPYFLNNARAIASLEGMALTADPSFSVLQAVYPFALSMLLNGSDASPLLKRTLTSLTSDAATGEVDVAKVSRLVQQLGRLSRRPRRRVLADIAATPGGRRLALRLVGSTLRRRLAAPVAARLSRRARV